jgi:HAD superfamily hydrolase (TIGR01549 family)
VLFDLDGVLVDSYYCWFHMLQDVMREQGKTPVTLEEFHTRWGQGPEADREVFFPEWTVEEVIAFYERRFPQYTRWTEPEEGSDIALQRLQSLQKKIGVASNSPTAIVEDLLTKANLRPFVDVIVGADQVHESKPAPDLLMKTLEFLKLTTIDVCYVGDSIYDAKAAEAAGVYFIGYKRPGDITVQDFAEFIGLFDSDA